MLLENKIHIFAPPCNILYFPFLQCSLNIFSFWSKKSRSLLSLLSPLVSFNLQSFPILLQWRNNNNNNNKCLGSKAILQIHLSILINSLKYFSVFLLNCKIRHASSTWKELIRKSLCLPIFRNITEVVKKLRVYMVLGEAVTQLQTFVRDL